MKDEISEARIFKGKMNIKGLVRWALYYRGEPYKLATGKKDEKGVPVTRTAYRGKTVIYEDWCGASCLPINKYSEQEKGALRLEVHRKNDKGEIEVVWWDDKPEDITIQWLVLSPYTESQENGKPLPIYISGLRLISKNYDTQEFIVMEGV